MMHQMLFNLQNFYISDFSGGIELSNFVFTNNDNIRKNYLDIQTQAAIGHVNSRYPTQSGFVFYEKTVEIDADNLNNEIAKNIIGKIESKNTYSLMSLLDFFWFIKDNSISISLILGKIVGTSLGSMIAEGHAPSTSQGQYEDVHFTINEIKEAHSLWLIFKEKVISQKEGEREDTIVYEAENKAIIRSRIKGFNSIFDYNKTNCLERAMHFLNIARQQEYLIYKIALYMPILECLFCTNSNEITTKLRYRVAFYMGSNREERIEIDKLIKDCYNIRSIFLHGQVYRKEKLKDVTAPKLMAKIKFKIRKNVPQLLSLIAIIIMQSSCQSNEIYIDFDKQLICSNSSKGIQRLGIENDSDLYYLTWSNPTKDAPSQLSIFPLTEGYIVRGGGMDTIVNLNYFKLRKNQMYIIERAQGDASPFSIKVLMDEKGNFSKIVH